MDSFNLIGYSFGSIIALKLAEEMENRGKKGRVLLIDGSPWFIKSIIYVVGNDDKSEEYTENLAITYIISTVYPEGNEKMQRAALLHSNWDDKITELIKLGDFTHIYSEDFKRKFMTAIKNRIKMVTKMNLNDFKILQTTSISLFRSSQNHEIAEDYGLSKYSLQKISIKRIAGDHHTILDNPELEKLINEFSSD